VSNLEVQELIYKTKYLQDGETFREGMTRIAGGLQDNDEHFQVVRDILLDRRFLPAGRIQVSIGATKSTTPYNCFVSGTIEDSLDDIAEKLKESLQTLRLGGGIGYDFSTLRPSGERIRSLDSSSCGPAGDANRTRGFMDLFDAGCSVISSAGHRRGAQMAVLRVDHPDIRHFVRSKRTPGRLTNFNISVGATDEFMEAVETDNTFDLRFEGRVYETIRARNLWDEIMRSTWDYAEPGVLFLDTINRKNNLHYIERIAATNPCGEQPLPPYGACLLGSFNLTKYIVPVFKIIRVTEEGLGPEEQDGWEFDLNQFFDDIPPIVRAMDNVIDRAIYPLPEQEKEAKTKRRMGLGITGLANTLEILGFRYGSPDALKFTEQVLRTLRDTAYEASIELAKEKGSFPAFDPIRYVYNTNSFISTLPRDIQDGIANHGIRNSHLLSIAPTGTISLAAGNVSSGIEPPYTTGAYKRNIYDEDGNVRTFDMLDYAEEHYGVKGVTSDECSVDDHVAILNLASRFVDSSVSKTCNVGPDVTFSEFKEVYMKAYKGGASGITTFRPAEYGGKREGIMKKAEPEVGAACVIDDQGNRSCD
jgi:ribonucleoside-diphosphate reductase alpha chain